MNPYPQLLTQYYTIYPDQTNVINYLEKYDGSYKWRANTLLYCIIANNSGKRAEASRLLMRLKSHQKSWKNDYWVVLHLKRAGWRFDWIRALAIPARTPEYLRAMNPGYLWPETLKLCGETGPEQSFYLMLQALSCKNRAAREQYLEFAMYLDQNNNQAYIYWIHEMIDGVIEGADLALLDLLNYIWEEMGDLCPSYVVFEAQKIIMKHKAGSLGDVWAARRLSFFGPPIESKKPFFDEYSR